jgi:Anthrone oxygenase
MTLHDCAPVHPHARRGDRSALLLLAGSALYLAGAVVITGVRNAPLNDGLAALDPGAPASAAGRSHHVAAWSAWNHVRGLLCVAAAGLLALALADWRRGPFVHRRGQRAGPHRQVADRRVACSAMEPDRVQWTVMCALIDAHPETITIDELKRMHPRIDMDESVARLVIDGLAIRFGDWVRASEPAARYHQLTRFATAVHAAA